jgi:hypothetical protein
VPSVTGRAIFRREVIRLDGLQTTEFPMGQAVRAIPWVLLAVVACSPSGDGAKSPRTERERDSVLGASQLPGAGGVRGALRATDSAEARNARLDSVATQR